MNYLVLQNRKIVRQTETLNEAEAIALELSSNNVRATYEVASVNGRAYYVIDPGSIEQVTEGTFNDP